MMFNAIAIILHLVAINIWVGGMFFIIIVLGKVVATLDIPEQHAFWKHILQRFFTWVWLAVVILLGTGIAMIVYRFGGLQHAPVYILLMASFGVLMVLVFFLVYFVFYQRFQRDMQKDDWESCRQQLKIIRRLGIVNMLLGFCVVMVIGGGPFIFL